MWLDEPPGAAHDSRRRGRRIAPDDLRIPRRRAPDGRLRGSRRHPTEDRSIDLETLVRNDIVPIVAALAVLIVLLILVSLLLLRRTRALSRRLADLTRGDDGQSLEALVGSHLSRIDDVLRELDRLEAREAVIERDLGRTLGRVGLVRYNPFDETGGNLSFALAVLDAHGDGFVVSSLHARQGTRVYAKALRVGRSETALSGEEEEAVRRALGTPGAGGPG